MTKKIYLWQGSGRNKRLSEHYALVDSEDYDHLMQWEWNLMKIYHTESKIFYARRCEGVKKLGTFKAILMHREVANPDKKMVVDHINGNGLDNTRLNLRSCSYAENLSNRKKNSNSKYRYRGLQKYKFKDGTERWKIQVTFNNKKWEKRGFISDDIAALAYNEKVKELKGEFAKLNVIRWY